MSDDVITRILAVVEGLQRGQEQFRAELIERVDRLQDKLTAQHEGAGSGSTERAERVAKTALDEVRLLSEQVDAMFRRIRHLQSELRDLRREDDD